ncbi:MAG: TIGR03905 family TSCPD domain-containing protein [Spirochaetaceae bacterium]|nr:TIGR03905 family TSCPD domain-containing protein [Spirochaetaceae bacterium]
MIEYTPRGTCSSKINFDIRDGKVYAVSFKDGCDGNLKALSALVEGMDAPELVKKLKGINCGGKGTSCADQLARAVEASTRPAVL